ncbi:MAG: type II toxin-antitoxin system VapC family toxin [Vicinamibacterales bacterium]|nr:type II toxin-antitoxin system VapC family toxin [Vicinamibacterales bacterium]
MIHLDTSVLVDALTGPRRSAPALRALIAEGERISFSVLVLYEWLRGPRRPEDARVQEALFPSAYAAPFGRPEAALAAELDRAVRRPRGREIDLAIAATAIVHDAALWTLNPRDFADIPRLRLAEPRSPARTS